MMNKQFVIGTILLLSTLVSSCSSRLINQAESKYIAQDFHEASKYFGLYLADHPNAYSARRKLAYSLFKEGHIGQAAEEFKKVIDLQPADSFSHLYLGLIHLQQCDYPKALAHWQQSDFSGRPLIGKELELQRGRVKEIAPEFTEPQEFMDLATSVGSELEKEFFAEQRRNAYNASRLGECG